MAFDTGQYPSGDSVIFRDETLSPSRPLRLSIHPSIHAFVQTLHASMHSSMHLSPGFADSQTGSLAGGDVSRQVQAGIVSATRREGPERTTGGAEKTAEHIPSKKLKKGPRLRRRVRGEVPLSNVT